MDKRSVAVFHRTGNTEVDHVRHDRAWWRLEARRCASDWCATLRLHAEVVARWRARHDPDCGGAAA
jgi:hypothetical protein